MFFGFVLSIVLNTTVCLAQLRTKLASSERHAVASSGSALTVESRLGMTLRWLSGGSYLDVAIIFGVSSKMFTAYATPVLLSIRDSLSLRFPVGDAAALEQLELGFRITSFGRMKGCVAAGTVWVCMLVWHECVNEILAWVLVAQEMA